MSLVSAAEIESLLELRRHMAIVHHLPGRIRLRFGPALWGKAAHLDRDLFQKIVTHLEGIRDVRLNRAVASVVIEYDPSQVHPDAWETLAHGDSDAAAALLDQWLTRHDQLLRNTLMEKE